MRTRPQMARGISAPAEGRNENMSDSQASLQRKIASRRRSPIRCPHDESAGRIEHRSVREIGARVRGLLSDRGTRAGACFRENPPTAPMAGRKGQTDSSAIGAIVFGSDQGLVGQFNDVVADYAIKTIAALPGKPDVWAVGERVHARLADAGLTLMGLFPVPSSVEAIAPLVGQIQIESEAERAKGGYARLYVFHNRPQSGALV